MRSRCADGDAHVAALAVHIVFAYTMSDSTQAAVIAVVYRLVAIVVPELAFRAVVPCSILLTLYALIRSGLRRLAKHAKHVLRLLTNQ